MMEIGEFLQFVRGRRSIRKFREDPVPKEIIYHLIEAASWAPSASNRQDWEFTVIASPGMRQKMGEIVQNRWQSILAESLQGAVTDELKGYVSNFDWFSRAPVVVVVSAKRPERFLSHLLGETAEDVEGGKISAAMATQNLMLAAHAAGIGSCCVTGPLAAREALGELLGLGKRRAIVCLVALGYPAEEPAPPSRRPVSKIVRFLE